MWLVPKGVQFYFYKKRRMNWVEFLVRLFFIHLKFCVKTILNILTNLEIKYELKDIAVFLKDVKL